MIVSFSRLKSRLTGTVRLGLATSSERQRAPRGLPSLGSPIWPASIAGGLVVIALAVFGNDSSGSITLTMPIVASEDTFVKSTRSSANYGQDATLQVDTSPSHKRALLRFRVVGIPLSGKIESATLRLFVVDRSNQSGSVHRVNGSWNESTIWTNAPAVGSQIAVISGAADNGTWKETNVKSVVNGNGVVDLYVITGSTDGVDYASTEAGQHPPTLVVKWSVPVISGSPTPSATPPSTPLVTPGPTPPAPTTPPLPSTPATPGACSTCATYYVDSASGNDANHGRSEGAAWRTLGKAATAPLAPGDRLLFKRGGSWTGQLNLSKVGTSAQPVVIGAYGSGALPLIQGGSDCVNVTGTYIVVTQLQLSNCGWAGLEFTTNARFNRVENSVMTGNVAGVFVHSGASDNQVIGNTIQNNTKMSVNDPGGGGDNGAFGVLLNGDRTEVAHNTISGHDAFSYDYGRDGAAVEVYGGQGNHVHHNLGIDNDAFSELGDSRSRDNTFAYNVVRSSLPDSIFIVTRGGGSGYGPVANTRLINNTVFLTGGNSQGFVCHAGCNSSVLYMRNNIIHAVKKAGYADGGFDEDYGVYSGGQVQFSAGPNSRVANPMFVNSGAGDFHLNAGSPAVDTAVVAGYIADFEGGHVPHDGNNDGVAVVDRGAFERGSTSGPIVAPPPTAGPTQPPAPAPTAAPTPAPPPPPPPTQPPTGGDVVLVGAGDIAFCGSSGDEATASLLDGIAGTVFTLGDNVYEDGTAQQFADCYNPSWGRHKGRTNPVVGNHDYHVSGAPGYYGYFGSRGTPQQPTCTSACKGYYSYNVGSWHVIVLNSECSTSYQACNMAEMDQWVRSDLAANPAACTVAMWHRPVLTIGPHSNDEGSLKPIWRILYDNNVDLVLNGHEHSYARYAPLNREANGVDSARGIRQIVVGTGGKGLTTSTRAGSTPGLEAWQDAQTANALGVLKLTLRSANFDWQFVPVPGKSFTDSGTSACH